MINYFLGLSTLILILFTLIKYFKNDQAIFNLLTFAFFLRALLLILNNFFFDLPGSTFDARTFEYVASEFSNQYGLKVIFNMFQNDVYLISRIISFFYSLTSQSEMMAQSISLGLGTASVYLVYRLSMMLWDKNISIKAAWAVSIYPPMVLYSVLTLREVYVNFFLLLTLIACVSLIKNLFKKKIIYKNRISNLNNNIKLLIFIVGGFFILKYFHGAIFTGLFIFLFFIGYLFFEQELNNLKKGIIKYKIIFLFLIILMPIFLWFQKILYIPYIPGIDEILRFDEVLLRRFNLGSVSAVHGIYGASYPNWTIPNNNIEFIPKTFLRIIYFLYSPFPWDLKRIVHSFGFLDTLFIIYFTICALRNRKAIWENRETRFLLFVLITFIIIYGVGTSNFGTAIRHKSKFIFILICLADPKLQKIRFF